MNLLIRELIYVAKHHLALILIVILAGGVFYFLIPYVVLELSKIETSYTSFVPLGQGEED